MIKMKKKFILQVKHHYQFNTEKEAMAFGETMRASETNAVQLEIFKMKPKKEKKKPT